MRCMEIALCSHLWLAVDRIEGDYAVVEWRATAEITDISLSLFQPTPRDGELWVFTVLSCSDDRSGIYNPLQHSITDERGTIWLSQPCDPQNRKALRLSLRRHDLLSHPDTPAEQ
jgi:hypothetical protein